MRNWLRTPFAQGFLIAVVFFSFVVASEVVLYLSSRDVLRATVNEELAIVTRLAAHRLDVNRHATITSTNQQNTPEYDAVVAPWREMLKSAPELRFIYSVRMSPEGPRFALDASLPVDADKDGTLDQAQLDELYESPDSAMLRALKHAVPAVSEEPYTDKWGTFISSFYPVRDASGRVECVVGVDITAAKYLGRVARMRMALNVGLGAAGLGSIIIGMIIFIVQRARQASQAEMGMKEARFRGFFDLGMIGMAITSQSKGWIEVNQSLCDILGYSRDELCRKTWTELTHPDDLAPDVANFERVARGESEGYSMEKRFMRKDGEVIDAEISACCVRRPDGTIDHFVALVSDITERKSAEREMVMSLKQSESVLQTISTVSASPSMTAGDLPGLARLITVEAAAVVDVERVSVWLFDDRAEQLQCIDLFERTPVKHSSGAILRKKDFKNEFAAFDNSAYVDAHDAHTDPRTAGYVQGYLVPCGITSMLDIVIRIAGRIRGVICFEHVRQPHRWESWEISFGCQLANHIGMAMLYCEQRLAAEELTRARDAAQSANRAKSDFLATMSHEIRTPMNGVIGFSDLLADSPLNEDQKIYANTIKGAADALLTIINDILDFSKIEAGKLQVEHLPFNARNVAAEAVELLTAKATQSGFPIILDWPVSVPDAWIGDTTRFRQVLLNLLGNAIKFTKHGFVLLRARVIEPGRVKLEIVDTGIGIPPEAQAQLFNKFTQADSSTTRKFGGTGLGLAICKQLAELMGGQIGLHSETGRGSTFWFTHPVPLTNTASSLPPQNPVPLGTRVLVVDALLPGREVLCEQMQSWEVECDAVASAAECLASLTTAATAKRPYKLVIIDSSVAGAEMVELAGQIRANESLAKSRLILLAPAASRADGDSFLAAGFAAVLWKPYVRYAQLTEAVQNVVNSQPTGYETTFITRPAPVRKVSLKALVADAGKVSQTLAGRILQKAGCEVDIVDSARDAAERASAKNYDIIFLDCQSEEEGAFETTRQIRAREETDKRRTPIIALADDVALQTKCRSSGMDDCLIKPVKVAAVECLLARWAA